MGKNLTKNEVKKIAEILNWNMKDIKSFIKDYKSIKSIIDHNELLRLCISSNNPEERLDNAAKLINDRCNDIENTIIAIINEDVLIDIIELFNVFDFVSDKNIKFYHIFSNYEFTPSKKIEADNASSFRLKYVPPVYLELNISKLSKYLPYADIYFGKYFSSNELSYLLCDLYIYCKLDDELTKLIPPVSKDDEIDYEEIFMSKIILKLFPVLEFKLLNINSLKYFLIEEFQDKYLPYHNEFITKFLSSLINIQQNRNIVTKKLYWFIYCSIEKLHVKGYNTKAAAEIVAKYLGNDKSNSVRTRYYDIRSTAEKIKDFDLDSFINEQGFTQKINSLLERLDRENYYATLNKSSI